MLFCYVREKTDMAVRLFDALKVEAPSFRMAIQEAIISLASSYKVSYLVPCSHFNDFFLDFIVLAFLLGCTCNSTEEFGRITAEKLSSGKFHFHADSNVIY